MFAFSNTKKKLKQTDQKTVNTTSHPSGTKKEHGIGTKKEIVINTKKENATVIIKEIINISKRNINSPALKTNKDVPTKRSIVSPVPKINKDVPTKRSIVSPALKTNKDAPIKRSIVSPVLKTNKDAPIKRSIVSPLPGPKKDIPTKRSIISPAPKPNKDIPAKRSNISPAPKYITDIVPNKRNTISILPETEEIDTSTKKEIVTNSNANINYSVVRTLHKSTFSMNNRSDETVSVPVISEIPCSCTSCQSPCHIHDAILLDTDRMITCESTMVHKCGFCSKMICSICMIEHRNQHLEKQKLEIKIAILKQFIDLAKLEKNLVV